MRLEQIDWTATFPFLRLFEAFRMAIWPPGKLLLALLLMALLWIGGGLMDAVSGPRVLPGEIEAYARETRSDFDAWLSRTASSSQTRFRAAVMGVPLEGEATWDDIAGTRDQYRRAREAIAAHHRSQLERLESQYHASQRDAELQERERRAGVEPVVQPSLTREEYEQRRAQLFRRQQEQLAGITALEPRGIFSSALQYKLDAFERMVSAAIALDFGFSQLAGAQPVASDTVLGALRDLAIVLPGWLLARHPIFLGIWCLFAMVLWSLFGGAISRMAALHATRQEPGPAGEALRFARQRWFWFFLTPWIPLLIAGLGGLAVAVVGLLFNVAFLDIREGVAFGALLLVGFLVAMALVFVAIGAGLFYPAIAVEGTDSFDALSRSGNYVFGRFWHWAFYTITALVYGAILYLILAGIAFLTLKVTRFFVHMAVMATTPDGRNRFDVILPEPQIGELYGSVDWSQLGMSGVAAAGLVAVWVYLLIGLLAAFAISYYFCAHTWIYLLLRRSADGTETDEVYLDDPGAQPQPAPEKLDEPVAEKAE